MFILRIHLKLDTRNKVSFNLSFKMCIFSKLQESFYKQGKLIPFLFTNIFKVLCKKKIIYQND